MPLTYPTGLKLELGLRIVSQLELQLSLGWGHTYMTKAFFGTLTGHQKIGTYENVTRVVYFKKLSIDSRENLDVVDGSISIYRLIFFQMKLFKTINY